MKELKTEESFFQESTNLKGEKYNILTYNFFRKLTISEILLSKLQEHCN